MAYINPSADQPEYPEYIDHEPTSLWDAFVLSAGLVFLVYGVAYCLWRWFLILYILFH